MRRFVLLLFFVSGACGLVYEVVWTRVMGQVFGSTAVAVGLVLGAFMAGMAGGSFAFRRAADRSPDPLRLYAKLELGLALAAPLAHLLMLQVTPAWVALHGAVGGAPALRDGAQFLLAFLLVMAPTVLMGATLPVLTRAYARRMAGFGGDLGALYAANTLGAVAGALAAGFVLIGALGLHGTLAVAVAGNVLVGAAAWALAARPARAAEAPRADEQPAADADPALTPALRALVLAGLALSGLSSFAYEVLWTRALVFVLGSSTYAVTTMLVAFLLGIALGGAVARLVADRVRDRVALFGWLQLGIAGSACAALPILFAELEPQRIRVLLGAATHDVGRQMLLRLGVALGTMLVPALLIGVTFPLVGRIAVARVGQAGAAVGGVYALNTLGNVVGALLPGLVLLRWLGIQRGILAMALLNGAVGVAVLAVRAARAPRLRVALPVAVVALAVALGRAPFDFRFPSESQAPWHRTLYYREGPTATTQVLLDPDTREKFMSVDGIDIGGNGFTDFKQQLLAHLPKLLVDDVGQELSIGLGSAILVGESARHAGVERIVCVEIAPSVVEGAGSFDAESHGVLADPRLELVVDDVSRHLLTTDDVYDVVSADEKTAQDHASNGFSYSREYYERIRARLAPGGLLAQWVPTTLPHEQYRMVLRTFASVLPYVQVWYFPPATQPGAVNTLLVGSREPLRPDFAAVERRLAAAPEAFGGLARYGLSSAGAVLAHLVADERELRRAVADAPLNTFARPRYEFTPPAAFAVPRPRRLAANHAFLLGLRERAAPALLAEIASDAEAARLLGEAFAAERLLLEAYTERIAGAPEGALLERYAGALAMAPWNDSVRARLSLLHWEASGAHSERGDYGRAAELMQRAIELHDGRPITHVELALVLTRQGRTNEALEHVQRAVELEPALVAGHRTRAQLLLQLGRREAAVEALYRLLEVEPGDAAARGLLRELGAG